MERQSPTEKHNEIPVRFSQDKIQILYCDLNALCALAPCSPLPSSLGSNCTSFLADPDHVKDTSSSGQAAPPAWRLISRYPFDLYVSSLPLGIRSNAIISLETCFPTPSPIPFHCQKRVGLPATVLTTTVELVRMRRHSIL